MKNLSNLYECILIVVLFAVLLVPEMLYSCLLRARDKVIDMVGELTNK